MRLFFAIEVNDAVRARAVAIRRQVEQGPGPPARGLRWVSPGHLHLTLRFLGEVEEIAAARVIAASASPLAAGPVEIAFGAIAWLPSPGSPRVMMLPLARGAAELRALKSLVDDRLPPGVPPEEGRPFTPHLTLARVRDDWRREARALARGLTEAPAPPATLPVSAVVLFESRLSARGPEYHERARMALAAGR